MRNFTLKLKNVYYKIGEREILKNICFECKEGEIIGIIGPNGSGKTTLLKTINGINKIDKGTILLNERNITEYKEKELAKKIIVVATWNGTIADNKLIHIRSKLPANLEYSLKNEQIKFIKC